MAKASQLLGLALSVGCVQTNAAVLDPSASYQKTCPDGVVVYTTPERVGKPYREVALLNSKGESGWTSEAGMVNSQRKKAAEVGANGLILSGVDEPKAGTKIIGALLGTGSERKGKALAIYVPEDSIKTSRMCSDKTSNTTMKREDAPGALGYAQPLKPQPVVSARDTSKQSVKAQPTSDGSDKASTSTTTQPSLVDDVPPGTNWIANARTRTYYKVECPGSTRIPMADRLFYASESSLKAAGFKPADDC
jgi:hypothetical protein